MENPISESSMRKSDKIIGGALAILGVVIVGYLLTILLPIAIALATNTIVFLAELLIAGILAVIVFDRGTWTSIYYGWKNLARAIRRAIVSSDPVGVLDTVLHRLDDKLGEIDDSVKLADAAKKRQAFAIKDAFARRDDELNLAKAADKQGKSLQVQQHALAADRWDKSAEKMQPMLDMLTGALVSMERARDLCAVKIEDAKNQKLVLQRQLDAFQSGQSAIRKIKRFLGRNPELEMQELAVEDIEKKATEAMAEIDQFMRVVNPSLEAQDLRRSAEQEAAMAKFDKFITGQSNQIQLPSSGATPLPAVIVSSERVKELKK